MRREYAAADPVETVAPGARPTSPFAVLQAPAPAASTVDMPSDLMAAVAANASGGGGDTTTVPMGTPRRRR